MTYIDVDARFWARVKIGTADECWLHKGRGTTRYKGASCSVGRIAWILTYKDPGPDVQVWRVCGEKKCCNPAHMRTGTPVDYTPKNDYTGVKHNMLTFVRPTDRRSNRQVVWELICDCGTTVYRDAGHVLLPRIKSCGCKLSEAQEAWGPKSRKYDPYMSTAKMVWGSTYRDCNFDTFLRLTQLPCHYCGRQPHRIQNRKWSKGKGKVSDYQLREGIFTYNGLDRVDSSKGHSDDNVVPCCFDCNWMKGARPVAEFIAHIRRMYEHSCKSETLTIAPELTLGHDV